MKSKKILGGGENGESADVNTDMATRNTAIHMGRDTDVVIMFIIL